MAHGTITEYRKGCHCEECKRASHRTHSRSAYFKARGIKRRVPNRQGQRVIKALVKKGWPIDQIASATGIGDATLDKIHYGRQKYVMVSTLRKLEALEAAKRRPQPKAGYVDSTLPMEAVRGLAAQSWPYTWVAEQIGVHHDSIARLALGQRKFILRDSAEKIYAVCREVGSSTGPHSPTGTKAARKGWRPTMYIDDLV